MFNSLKFKDMTTKQQTLLNEVLVGCGGARIYNMDEKGVRESFLSRPIDGRKNRKIELKGYWLILCDLADHNNYHLVNYLKEAENMKPDHTMTGDSGNKVWMYDLGRLEK